MRRIHTAVVAAVLGGWLAPPSPAAPPETITFQGRLTDADGVPVDETLQMTFKLYNGTSEIWSGTHPGVIVTGGGYSVMLGEINDTVSLGSLDFSDAYTLGITVGADAEMSPRLSLGASPYAFRAKYADSVTDGVYTTGSYADPGWITSLAASKLTGTVAVANGGTGSSTQNFVDLSTAQSIGGVKTFTETIAGSISGDADTVDGQHAAAFALAAEAFVDGGNAFGAIASIGTTDAYALTLKTSDTARVVITSDGQVGVGKVPTTALDVSGTVTATGFSGSGAGLTDLDVSDLSGVVAIANGGTGSSTQNFVDLSSTQTIGGAKTFSSPITGSISGNAGTVTSGVYTSGSYADPGWITSLAGSKVSGNITGNAANVTGTVAAANGGTGLNTSATAAGSILRTSAVGTWAALAPGTNGQVLKMSGGLPAWGTDTDTNSGGTVTSITQGTGLTFSTSPLTTSGTIGINTSVVPRLSAANTFTTTQTISLSSNLAGLVIKGSASQSANLMEFYNSANTLLAYIDELGNFEQTGNITASTDNFMSLGTEGVRWARAYFGPGSVHVIAKKDELGLEVDREWTIGVQVQGQPTPGSFRLMERVGKKDTMSVTPDGRVGIGTMDPSPKLDGLLDVRGNIKMGAAGDLFAVGGTENLRTLRGQVDSKGVPVVGTGFVVEPLTDNIYRIRYETPFADPAVPTVNPISREANQSCSAVVLKIDPGFFEMQTFVQGTPGACAFTFVVVGAN